MNKEPENKDTIGEEKKPVPQIVENPKFYIKVINEDKGIGFVAFIKKPGTVIAQVFENPVRPVSQFETRQEAADAIINFQLNFNEKIKTEVVDTNEVLALNTTLKPYDTIYFIQNQAGYKLCSESTKGYHFRDTNEDFCQWGTEDDVKQAKKEAQAKFKVMQISIGRILPLEPMPISLLDKSDCGCNE